MFKALCIKLASSAIYNFSKSIVKSISKKETTQYILSKLEINKSLSDFPNRYVETLVEFRLADKSKAIMEFFREESIMKIYYDYYYAKEDTGLRFNEEKFNARLNHYLDSLAVGDTIKQENIDIRKEIGEFKKTFDQNVDENSSVFQAKLHKDVKEIKEIVIKPDKQVETQYPKKLTINIPTRSVNSINGRDKELKEIHNKLFNNGQIVVISGLGGIGKTAVAQTYTHKYWDKYFHIAWVSNSYSIKSSFVNSDGLIDRLNIDPTNLGSDKVFDKIIDEFEKFTDQPNLLIIDNAEADVIDIISTLPKPPNWHVLITSRISNIKDTDIIELDFLSKKEAFALFKRFYKSKKLNNEEIFELLKNIDYHTLIIETFAKTASKQRYSFDILKQAIQENIYANVKLNKPNNDQVDKITSYLVGIFKLGNLSELEFWILKQFVCIPNDFHHVDYLFELLVANDKEKRNIFYGTITELYEKGWLIYNENTERYKMHRIIAEVINKQVKINEKDINHLIKSINNKIPINKIKNLQKFEEWSKLVILFELKILGVLNIESTLTNEKDDIKILQNDLAEWFNFIKDGGLDKFADETNTLIIICKAIIEFLDKEIQDCYRILEVNPENSETYLKLGDLYKNLNIFNPNVPDQVSHKGIFNLVIENYAMAMELNPKFSEAYFHRGAFFYDNNKPSKALEDFNKAIQLNPDYLEAFIERARFFSDNGEHQKAIDDYNKAISLGPENAELYFKRGHTYSDIGELEKAIENYEKCVELYPENANGYYSLGLANGNNGMWEKALQYYEKAIDLNPEYAEAYCNMGLLYFDEGEYDIALENYSKSIDLDPELVNVHCNRGIVYYFKGIYNKAIEDFNNAIKVDPKYINTYSLRGMAYNYIGEYDKAIESHEMTIKLNPEYAPAYLFRGFTYSKMGKPDKAMENYIKAIELNPKYAEGFYCIGIIYSEKMDYNKAIKSYDKAIEINPEYIEAYYYRGTAYLDLGECERAFENYDKAIELNPKYEEGYYYIGKIYSQKGNYNKAIKNYDKAIEINPNHIEPYYYRGTAYSAIEEHKRAFENYNKAIELNPIFAEEYHCLGKIYFIKGDYNKAIEHYDKAIKLIPEFAEAFDDRGKAYSAKGEHEKAKVDFTKFKELKNRTEN